MTTYTSGQRFISLAEPELGLGIISELEGRKITVKYPLTEESRVYSSANTPLIRCQFSKGDAFISNSGDKHIVEDVSELDGLLFYTTNLGEEICEIQIAPDQGRVSPLKRLMAGQIGSIKWFNLYKRLIEGHSEYQGSPSHGFVGPKINLIPHQFDVAQQILKMPLPRALLADEVGLGKTIEAGLVIHQLMASNRAQRILICVPHL